MVNRNDGIMLIAIICLIYKLYPEDLENIAKNLSEFDSINDALTGEFNNVACN